MCALCRENCLSRWFHHAVFACSWNGSHWLRCLMSLSLTVSKMILCVVCPDPRFICTVVLEAYVTWESLTQEAFWADLAKLIYIIKGDLEAPLNIESISVGMFLTASNNNIQPLQLLQWQWQWLRREINLCSICSFVVLQKVKSELVTCWYIVLCSNQTVINADWFIFIFLTSAVLICTRIRILQCTGCNQLDIPQILST